MTTLISIILSHALIVWFFYFFQYSEVSLEFSLYVTLCTLLAIIAAVMAEFIGRKLKVTRVFCKPLSEKIYINLAFLGSVLYVFDAYVYLGASILTFATLVEYRDYLVNLGGNRYISMLWIFNPFLMMMPVLIYARWTKLDILNRFMAISSYFSFIIFSSAKSSLFISLLILFLYIVLSENRGLMFLLKRFSFFSLLLGCLFVIIPVISGRESNFELLLFYISGPVAAASFLFENNEFFDEYGLLSFKYLGYIFSKLNINFYNESYMPYVHIPFPTNAYMLYGVLLSDYGYGVPLIIFLTFGIVTGFLLGRSTLGAEFAVVRYRLILAILLCAYIMGLFHDYFFSSFVFVYLLFLIYLFPPNFIPRLYKRH